VIGYRAWLPIVLQAPANHQPGLRGLFWMYVWQPGINCATCDLAGPSGLNRMRHSGEMPHDHGQCGLWALPTLEEVPAYTDHFNLLPPVIYGQVECWGKTVEHTAGFRSEFAQIVSLYTSPNFTEWEQRRIEMVAQRYDVPVETADLPIKSDLLTQYYRRAGYPI
jgi:hypothetical protein